MKVKCISNEILCGDYTLGKTYDLECYDNSPYTDMPYCVYDNNGEYFWAFKSQFKVVDDTMGDTVLHSIEEDSTSILEEYGLDKRIIKIKYFNGAKRLEKISKGDWVDLYANEDVFIEEGGTGLIPLGVAMELPWGYEAHVLPRSSTFKTWGIIQTNGMGVIDNSYCGDNDQWHMPVYCLESRGADMLDSSEDENELDVKCGVWIRKGDKICQFRIVQNQPPLVFKEVESLGNNDRSGFGSTGTK